MRLLIDVDAMCKLAHWNLLDALPMLTGIPWTACAYLASLKFRALKAQGKLDGRLFRVTDAANEVVRVIGLMGAPLTSDKALLPSFQDVTGIDAGEAVLLSSLASTQGAILLTGDKRAMRALAAMDRTARQPFDQRILPIERVLLAALDRHGLEWLRSRVCPWKAIDMAVSVVMGSRCDAHEAAVREALNVYLAEMISFCEPTLIVQTLPV
jgi:hypothetical protein